MASWNCAACTFLNDPHATCCGVCLTDRASLSAAAAATATMASLHSGAATGAALVTTTATATPVALTQMWTAHGYHDRRDVVTFSQRWIASRQRYHQQRNDARADPTFSNYAQHAPVTFDVPSFCGRDTLVRSGRSSTVIFTFSEKAIMLCKAALFGDVSTFDSILRSTDSREAKALGRRVTPWCQVTWDRMVCPITRSVMVVKMKSLPTMQQALLQTGDAWIAEATEGDWVWGAGMDAGNPDISYPARWRGVNILGWALMEARDEALAAKHNIIQVVAPPTPSLQTRSFLTDSDSGGEEKKSEGATKSSRYSIKGVASGLAFGPAAFGPLERAHPMHQSGEDLSSQVPLILEASVPEIRSMRGERGRKQVARMLSDIYQQGLFMHGGRDSAVNRMVIPAIRHIFAELHNLPPADEKRRHTARELAESCQDCQQVQARVILRLYGDFTAQTETFERQLKYSLVRQKEAALNVLITNAHPGCDLDHTQVKPSQQRAHLISGYTCLIGERYGLDGITTARGDRFLQEAVSNIGSTHRIQIQRNTYAIDASAESNFLSSLMASMDVTEWISALIADINNQAKGADRLIDRACIFQWAATNMDGDFKHSIFYEDERAVEFADLDPKEPIDDNKFEPFLSPKVLVEMLLKAGMLERRV